MAEHREPPPVNLSEVLGTGPSPGQTSPSAPASFKSAKALCRALLQSPEYRESVRRRMVLDELPPALECKIWEYAYGKPVDRIEVKDMTSYDALPQEEVEERIQRMLDDLREARATRESTSESVH